MLYYKVKKYLEANSKTWDNEKVSLQDDGSGDYSQECVSETMPNRAPWNGAAQTTATPTQSGTANIDTIGVRKTDINPYDGTISEIQIFDTESSAITANVNTYLSNL